MTSGQIYFILACIALAFGAGMYTESKFHLAGEVSKQNEQIVATDKGQKGSEQLAGDARSKKNEINDVPPIQENPHEKIDCAVPAGVFDQLSRTAATANRAAQ